MREQLVLKVALPFLNLLEITKPRVHLLVRQRLQTRNNTNEPRKMWGMPPFLMYPARRISCRVCRGETSRKYCRSCRSLCFNLAYWRPVTRAATLFFWL